MPSIVGREREFERVARVMATSRASLVCVAAAPAMGKTTVLRELRRRARNDGWTTLPAENDATLSVESSTTPDAFVADLRRRLSESPDRAFLETQGAAAPPVSEAAWDAAGGGLPSLRSPTVRRSEGLLDDLRASQPTMTVVDGYRPSDGFHRWFVDHLVGDVRALEGLRAVLVVSGTSAQVGPLQEVADEWIELGPLDESDVLEYLQEVGGKIEPPLGDKEARHYASSAARHPDLLGSLSRLLELLAS